MCAWCYSLYIGETRNIGNSETCRRCWCNTVSARRIAAMSDTPTIETPSYARDGRFVKGGKPGPGRPVGSRNRLGEAFIQDLLEDWHEHGPAVIRAVRRDDPGTYMKVLAHLLPQQ